MPAAAAGSDFRPVGVSDPVSHIEGSKYFEEIAPAVREKYITLFEEIKAGF